MNRINPEQPQKLIDHAGAGIEKLQQKANHNDGGDEMGRIADHLHRVLEPPYPDRIQAQREQHRQRRADRKGIQADNQRVLHNAPEIIGVEEARKMLESDQSLAHMPLTTL